MAGKTRKGSVKIIETEENVSHEDIVLQSSFSAQMQLLTKSVDNMNKSVDSLHTEIRELRADVDKMKDLPQSVDFAHKEILEVKSRLETVEHTVREVKNDYHAISTDLVLCKKKNIEMHEKLLQMDSYIRRENLKVSGIDEDKNESRSSTLKKIRDFLVNSLDISDGASIPIQRCHRIGAKLPNKPRDIFIRFLNYGDREEIWSKRKLLKGSGFFLKEDFPVEIDQRRAKLYPIAKAAWRNNKKALLVRDRLVMEGKWYDVNSLDKLPVNLQPASLASRVTDAAILFHGKDYYLSNFYCAPFTLDGKKFNSSEQYYQYTRAKHCSDDETAAEILATGNPVEQMKLGRKISATADQWNDMLAENIMETGIRAKFQQNKDLLDKLLQYR